MKDNRRKLGVKTAQNIFRTIYRPATWTCMTHTTTT